MFLLLQQGSKLGPAIFSKKAFFWRTAEGILQWTAHSFAQLKFFLTKIGTLTDRHQPLDQTYFACLKAKYRMWLTEIWHKNKVPSPSLECGAKEFLELIMGASPSIISSSWRRTKIPRFQSFVVIKKFFLKL